MIRYDKARAAAEAFCARLGEKKPLVMGVLNVTPDSFSDGGLFAAPAAALAHARDMAGAGADMIDIGAESTRPGFAPVDEDEEWARLEPVLGPLAEATPIPLSIDTGKAGVARRALALGCAIVNDVTGLRGDAEMAAAVAESGAALVVMHNPGAADPARDIVADMIGFFEDSLDLAARAGVEWGKIILDPGIGFGKTLQQNLAALAGVATLREHFELPVLIGVSRKSFLGALTGAPVEARLAPTIAANLAALARGAQIFRVHDVADHVAAIKIWSEIVRA